MELWGSLSGRRGDRARRGCAQRQDSSRPALLLQMPPPALQDATQSLSPFPGHCRASMQALPLSSLTQPPLVRQSPSPPSLGNLSPSRGFSDRFTTPVSSCYATAHLHVSHANQTQDAQTQACSPPDLILLHAWTVVLQTDPAEPSPTPFPSLRLGHSLSPVAFHLPNLF